MIRTERPHARAQRTYPACPVERTAANVKVGDLLPLVLATALLICGCATEKGEDGYGTASIAALTSVEVDRLEVTIDGTGFAETLSRDPVSGNFEPVVISDIPIGSYTFRARAYDDDVTPAELLYEGTADATVEEGIEISVTIVLQQVPPVDPFQNTVPIFQSLVYSPANPRTDEDVTLTVSVTDPDVGDTLTLLWQATGGGALIAPVDQPSVVWTAPSTNGTYPGSITASDTSGASVTLTANIAVQLRRGDSEVIIDLNTWPEVANLVPDPTRIDVGGVTTTSLTLTASDPDGDTLNYAWSADCTGEFRDSDPSNGNAPFPAGTPTTVANPDFTLTADNGGADCTISVTITDVDPLGNPRGGTNTAEVTIATGPEPSASSSASGCPCWDGGPRSVPGVTSVTDLWVQLGPDQCLPTFADDRCTDGLYSDGTTLSHAQCDSGTGSFQTDVRDFGTPGEIVRNCKVSGSGDNSLFPLFGVSNVIVAPLTPEEYQACLQEHDAEITLGISVPTSVPEIIIVEACGLGAF